MVTAYTPMPPRLIELRQRAMENRGIHTIYPLGQDYAPSYGYFSAYYRFTARVFGYILRMNSNEWSFYNQDGYAIMKFHDNKPKAIMKRDGGVEFTVVKEKTFWEGEHFSFAIRAVADPETEYYQALYEDEPINAVPLRFYNSLFYCANDGIYRVLSTHFSDSDSDATFPREGLHNLLETFVRFDVGTFLVYSGVYQGGGQIRLHNPHGAVPYFSSPSRAGTDVKIGIRITTTHFVFTNDYRASPVVAAFKDLTQSGFHFVPRFEPSFLVKHVLIESTRYYE